MTARRPNLALVRDGNPGNRPRARLEAGLRLPVERPPEPDWRTWWPTATGSRARNAVNTRARNVARTTWRRTVDVLAQQGLVTALDADLLADLAVVQAQLDGTLRTIARDGGVVVGQKGNTVRHPLWPVANQLRAHLRALWAEVGVGPIARDKMPAGGLTDDDADEIFD